MAKQNLPFINIDFMKIKDPIKDIINGIHDSQSGKILLGILKLIIFTIVATSIIVIALSTCISMPLIIPAIAGIIVTAYTLFSLIEFTKDFWKEKETLKKSNNPTTKIEETKDNTLNSPSTSLTNNNLQ